MLAIYNVILADCFQWRAPRTISWWHSTPRCVPLRALAWGYRCFALRAMSLRDGIPLPYSNSLRRIMLSLVKLSVVSTVKANAGGQSGLGGQGVAVGENTVRGLVMP